MYNIGVSHFKIYKVPSYKFYQQHDEKIIQIKLQVSLNKIILPSYYLIKGIDIELPLVLVYSITDFQIYLK